MHKRLASLGSLMCFIAHVLPFSRRLCPPAPSSLPLPLWCKQGSPLLPSLPSAQKKKLGKKMFKYPLCEAPGLYLDGNPQSSLGQGNGGLLGLP